VHRIDCEPFHERRLRGGRRREQDAAFVEIPGEEAIGEGARIGWMAPDRLSSPAIRKSAKRSSLSWPVARSTPRAMGRS